MPFATSDNSRRDNETCRLFVVRSLTNPPDWVISSPKTKGSGIHQKSRTGWSCGDSANVSQGRTNVNIQSTSVQWAVGQTGKKPRVQPGKTVPRDSFSRLSEAFKQLVRLH